MIIHTKEDRKYAEKIVKRIKKRLDRTATTKKELAEKAGISYKEVINILNYGRVPLITTLRKIAIALDVEVAELID